MMKATKVKLFCMKCGYQLVGPPLPRRCSECGYPVLHQARWREGELHLAGPTIVWPVAKRFVSAAAILFFSLVMSILFYSDVLLNTKLISSSTISFIFIPFFLTAPFSAFLWWTPIHGPASDSWDLHKQSVFRKWVLLCGMWFWVVAFFHIAHLIDSANPKTSVSANTINMFWSWYTIATIALVPALIGWLVVLLHVVRVSLYLRNEFPHRIWTALAWLCGVASLIVAYVCSKNESTLYFENMLWIFALFMIGISAVLALLTAWDVVNCLTHSYQSMAREERLAKQNSERYSAPK